MRLENDAIGKYYDAIGEKRKDRRYIYMNR